TELGWTDGRNARLDVRWTAGSVDVGRRHAMELVALAPDVIITDTSFNVAAVQQATRTVPIVFGGVIDPVGAGLVGSLARPGGNTTGFTAFEYAIGAKWLELLKEVAPRVTRAAGLRDSTIAAGIGQFSAIQATSPFGIVECSRPARCRRHRARGRGLCPRCERWIGRDGSSIRGKPSRRHPHAGRALQTARGLPLPLFRQRRGPDVV